MILLSYGQWITSTIGFPNTYPVDRDLSGGEHYLTFEQLVSGCKLLGDIPIRAKSCAF